MNTIRQYKDLTDYNKDRIKNLLKGMPLQIIENYHIDDEGLWSLTKYTIAKALCNWLLTLDGINNESVITDAMAGCGGNTIPFAQIFRHVNSAEMSPDRKNMLDANVKLYKINNVTTVQKIYNVDDFQQDVIYFDPPWGKDYKKHNSLSLYVDYNGERMPLHGVINKTIGKCKYIVVKLPVNYNLYNFERSLKNMIIIDKKIYKPPNSQMIIIIKSK